RISFPHYLVLPALFFFIATAPPRIYTLSLHDALPISRRGARRDARALRRTVVDRRCALGVLHGEGDARRVRRGVPAAARVTPARSEEHTSELQSLAYLVCRLLLEKKKKNN